MKLVQLLSVITYGFIAYRYLFPVLRRLSRAEALTWILWPHVFRYCVLYLFTAQKEGYPISDAAMNQLVVGDLVGAALALLAIFLLKRHEKKGVAVSWALLIATLTDMIVGAHQRMIEPPRADATGVWFMIFGFFAPLILVSIPLLIWQLYFRKDSYEPHATGR
jgi:hypothetical protein